MHSPTAPFACVALAALVAAGCGGDEPDGRDAAGARSANAVDDTGAASASAAGARSPITAEVLLEDRPSGVSLRVTLDGLAPDRRYPVHVHQGACGESGRVSLPLGRITARSDGTGSVRMTVAEDRLPERPFSVRVLDPDGSPVACRDIDAGAD